MTMSGTPGGSNSTGHGGSGNHGNSSGSGNNQEDCFVEVWSKNMEEEFARVRQVVQKYPYVSMVRMSVVY